MVVSTPTENGHTVRPRFAGRASLLGSLGSAYQLLIMAAIIAAALGLALYALAAYVSLGLAIALGVVAVVMLSLVVLSGAALCHHNPTASSYLMQGWSTLVLLAAGGVAAVGIYLGARFVVGDDAPDAEKAVVGAVGALVTLVVTKSNDWLEKKLAPWFCCKVVKRRYEAKFPCTPVGLGPGRQAQEAIASRCGSFSAGQWKRAAVQALLEKVEAAFAAGEFDGGPNWECLGANSDVAP
jgi:hypothetical protein